MNVGQEINILIFFEGKSRYQTENIKSWLQTENTLSLFLIPFSDHLFIPSLNSAVDILQWIPDIINVSGTTVVFLILEISYMRV